MASYWGREYWSGEYFGPYWGPSEGEVVVAGTTPVFYIWEPRFTFDSAPVSAFSWTMAPTTFGMDGYKHTGLCKLTYVSNFDFSLTFTVDGVAQTPLTVPSGSGTQTQAVFRVPVMKGKLWTVKASSTHEFRLDGRDSFMEIKEWGSNGPYNKLRVFSDFSMIEG